MQPLYQTVPPQRKSTVDQPNRFVRQPTIDRERDEIDQRRTLLAVAVVCAGVGVAAFALWQARVTRTVYVPVPMENVGTAMPPGPSAVNLASTGNRIAAPQSIAPTQQQVYTAPAQQQVTAAPAMPMTLAAVAPAAMPPPVDYAARDRQIADLKRRMEAIDETIRRVRADPHWYGIIRNSTDTSRQQSSDAYLDQLDKQRNELRREKWALEGR